MATHQIKAEQTHDGFSAPLGGFCAKPAPPPAVGAVKNPPGATNFGQKEQVAHRTAKNTPPTLSRGEFRLLLPSPEGLGAIPVNERVLGRTHLSSAVG
ncbi:MAG: hypothetical protein ACPGWR_33090, partial [Ardenticatenaceae bacterium]